MPLPSDPGERVDVLAQFVWAQACTGKFVWPVPDRGLKQRIHRIAAPTLIVWGDSDRIIAPVYAEEFAKRIAGARMRNDRQGRAPAAPRAAGSGGESTCWAFLPDQRAAV